MRILLASGAAGQFSYMQQFTDALIKNGAECKLIREIEHSRGFPSRNISEWFSKKKFNSLIEQFKPDIIFADRQLHFASNTIDAKIPLFLYLRGNYWQELDWAKETIYKNRKTRIILWFRNRIADKCFRKATVILPLSKYLADITKDHYPHKPIHVLHDGVDPSLWYKEKGMNLKHPCVGFLQRASIWGKTKEMLILPKIIEAFPEVTFYWAGGGTYENKILSELNKYDNFKFLGNIQYPDQVRKFLSEIDIFALMTGLETLGMSIMEASLIKKPVIATNVGGVPEVIINGETGFLVNEGDYQEWIRKINILLKDRITYDKISEAGCKFVASKFSWDRMAKEFLQIADSHVKK